MYPEIKLDQLVLTQNAITTDTFTVLEISENPDAKTLKAFVKGAPQMFWIEIFDHTTYHSEWTDGEVMNILKTKLIEKFGGAA